MSKKFCPMTFNTNPTLVGKGGYDCIESSCQWWVSMRSDTGIEISSCAISFIARKNSHGKIIV